MSQEEVSLASIVMRSHCARLDPGQGRPTGASKPSWVHRGWPGHLTGWVQSPMPSNQGIPRKTCSKLFIINCLFRMVWIVFCFLKLRLDVWFGLDLGFHLLRCICLQWFMIGHKVIIFFGWKIAIFYVEFMPNLGFAVNLKLDKIPTQPG